ncbi:hypothetical protein DFH07DRAFT_184295 [Mycena maculata]|uniref:Secreted protein n=1 Tax=Mycena maculata TaxID=230809 RepID=A0AAD7MRW0_9AGAR|nr:hypothetical protein DFH07DRAFT_184295 [Mycena maculata]
MHAARPCHTCQMLSLLLMQPTLSHLTPGPQRANCVVVRGRVICGVLGLPVVSKQPLVGPLSATTFESWLACFHGFLIHSASFSFMVSNPFPRSSLTFILSTSLIFFVSPATVFRACESQWSRIRFSHCARR